MKTLGSVYFILLTAKSWRRLWQHERRGTAMAAIGALLFLTGGVGLEIVSYGDLREQVDQHHLYVLEVAAEEALEMFGASVMLLGSARILFTPKLIFGALTPRE